MSDPRSAAIRLGEYRIVRSLACGGMAEVSLALTSGPQGFEKLVVLKKILPHLAAKPRYVRLFLDEAKLAASLDHPNIAQVHAIGQVDGAYCIAMEYVHGSDLKRVVARVAASGRPFPIDQAVRIVREVAAALHHAHERCGPDGTPLRIVHRDVSPSNIQISYDGAVKLIDFGVAKSEVSSIRTQTGTLKGKAGYMAPEQVQCGPVDRRTDVYALGIVLWELLSGRQL